MHAAAVPLLFVLGAGKLVGVLGASGQGAPTDLAWATAYVGPGPWGSLAADIPSHPSQVYEALLRRARRPGARLPLPIEVIARRDGAALYVALALWAVARFVAAFTWRDPVVAAPLRVDQLLLVAVLVIALVGLAERARAPLKAPAEPRIDIDARLAR